MEKEKKEAQKIIQYQYINPTHCYESNFMCMDKMQVVSIFKLRY